MMRANAEAAAKLEATTGEREEIVISGSWNPRADAIIYEGDCRELLAQIPDAAVQLVVTSPPYNIGKKYEKRVELGAYLADQRQVIDLCIDHLAPGGSICWQVGNHVDNAQVFPLDTLLYPFFRERGLKLRNRIIWHFGHGLHSSRRFSGRYETILWFTKDDSRGEYVFNLDPVRVPQKYPGKKAYKGPNKGRPTSHPLGKNPGDVWIIPNVKHNHVEKTIHPCQFPVELAERLVLALSRPGDLVLDPYMGAGSALAAAVMRGRRAAGADVVSKYVSVTRDRVSQAAAGTLAVRPRTRPVYEPPANSSLLRRPWEKQETFF